MDRKKFHNQFIPAIFRIDESRENMIYRDLQETEIPFCNEVEDETHFDLMHKKIVHATEYALKETTI